MKPLRSHRAGSFKYPESSCLGKGKNEGRGKRIKFFTRSHRVLQDANSKATARIQMFSYSYMTTHLSCLDTPSFFSSHTE